MILTDDPTPSGRPALARRLGLAYRREYEENLRNGIRKMPKIRAIRPGDLDPMNDRPPVRASCKTCCWSSSSASCTRS